MQLLYNGTSLRLPRITLSFIFTFVATIVFADNISEAIVEPAEVDNHMERDSMSAVVLDMVSVTAIKEPGHTIFPTTVTTLNSSTIERYDIAGLSRVSEIAPNFYMPQYGSRMTSSIYVRGLGTRIDQPVVGLNVDNVPILTKDAYDFYYPDMERIEVVRGPQATLYGRNTMGGVINIATTSPMAYQGVRASLEYGSANSVKAFAGVYMKPSATFAISATGAYSRSDGFFRNLYTGEKVDKERQGLIGVKTLWRPSSNFIIDNSIRATLTRQGGFPYQSLALGEINHNDTCFYRRKTLTDGLTIRWITDRVQLSSITSFQYLNDNMTMDQDFLPDDYFVMSQLRHEWNVTEDLVATGVVGGKYRWLGGLFGYFRRTNMHAPVTFHDDGLRHLIEEPMHQATGGKMSILWDERRMLLDSRFLMPDRGFAIYHKSEIELGDFTLCGSARLAWERAAIDYHSEVNTAYTVYANAGPQLIPVRPVKADILLADRLHQSSLQLLPELKVAYRISDTQKVGFVWSKGYKSGGYNTQMFSDILQQALMGSMGGTQKYDVDEIISYQPETSWNYELNYSATFPGANLHMDVAAFIINCRNQQITIFPDGMTTGRMMANAGRSRSMGVEVAGSWTPADSWRFDFSYGFADARLRSYNDGHGDYRGNHVPYAPVNTMFAAATYYIPVELEWLTGIDVTAGCRGVGKIYWNEDNSAVQPFYASLRADVTLHTSVADVNLWSENLTDTRYASFWFVSMGNKFIQRGNPRSFGVTFRFDFAAQ